VTWEVSSDWTLAAFVGNEPQERLPPFLEGMPAQIVTFETQKIKGHERGLRSAALDDERAEVVRSGPPDLTLTICYLRSRG
jgi:hypothetical protein